MYLDLDPEDDPYGSDNSDGGDKVAVDEDAREHYVDVG